jgi:hypothetical protein
MNSKNNNDVVKYCTYRHNAYTGTDKMHSPINRIQFYTKVPILEFSKFTRLSDPSTTLYI